MGAGLAGKRRAGANGPPLPQGKEPCCFVAKVTQGQVATAAFGLDSIVPPPRFVKVVEKKGKVIIRRVLLLRYFGARKAPPSMPSTGRLGRPARRGGGGVESSTNKKKLGNVDERRAPKYQVTTGSACSRKRKISLNEAFDACFWLRSDPSTMPVVRPARLSRQRMEIQRQICPALCGAWPTEGSAREEIRPTGEGEKSETRNYAKHHHNDPSARSENKLMEGRKLGSHFSR